MTDDTDDTPTARERAQLLSPLQSVLRLGLSRELARLKAANVSRAAMLRRKDATRSRLGLAGGGTLRAGELLQLAGGRRPLTLALLDDLERAGLDVHELLAAGDGLPSRAWLARLVLDLADELRLHAPHIRVTLGIDGVHEIVRLDGQRRAVEAELAADRPTRGELASEVQP